MCSFIYKRGLNCPSGSPFSLRFKFSPNLGAYPTNHFSYKFLLPQNAKLVPPAGLRRPDEGLGSPVPPIFPELAGPAPSLHFCVPALPRDCSHHGPPAAKLKLYRLGAKDGHNSNHCAGSRTVLPVFHLLSVPLFFCLLLNAFLTCPSTATLCIYLQGLWK